MQVSRVVASPYRSMYRASAGLRAGSGALVKAVTQLAAQPGQSSSSSPRFACTAAAALVLLTLGIFPHWARALWARLPGFTYNSDPLFLRFIALHSGLQERALRSLGFVSHHAATSMGKLRYLEFNAGVKGPTWFFLHGVGSQATDWAPVLATLAKRGGARVVALDLPGHGHSDPMTSERPQDLLRALREALDAVKRDGERIILVGNSMGGLGALHLAKTRPLDIEQLVLISPLGAPLTSQERLEILANFSMGGHAQALQFVDSLFTHGFRSMPFIFRFVMRHSYARCFRALYNQPHLQALVRQVQTDPFLQASDLQGLAPCLVIWGGNDHVLPASSRTFFESSLPPHGVHREATFSHSPFLDQPGAVLDKIDTWRANQGG